MSLTAFGDSTTREAVYEVQDLGLSRTGQGAEFKGVSIPGTAVKSVFAGSN